MHTSWAALLSLLALAPARGMAQEPARWPPNSMERSRPPIVTPAPAGEPVPPPGDAIVLFDGTDLAEWTDGDSDPAPWAVRDGYVEVVPGTGSMVTRRA
ncbi:MAG: hypothetical protein PVF27_10275, partial [Gemmatimonadales bacterium]